MMIRERDKNKLSARHRAKKRRPGPDYRRGENMFVWEISKSSNLQIIIFGRTNGAQFHDILIFSAWYLEERGKDLILFFWGGGPCANGDAAKCKVPF
jgi:hypothetical protein